MMSKISRFTEWIRKKKIAAGCAALAGVLVVGSVIAFQYNASQVPELPTFTDPIMETTIQEEETPLASKPTVTTDTKKSTKTTRKKVKTKKAAKKTYQKKRPKKTKTSTQTIRKDENTTVEITTTVDTYVTEKFKKKSKKKTVITKVVTTVKTTTTVRKPVSNVSANASGDSGFTSGSTSASTSGSSTASSSGTNASKEKYVVDINSIAPLMDSRVRNAFKTLGFTIEVDPSVSYAGHFDARTRKITLKYEDNTVYHELGHFLAFIAGNVDTKADFKSVYNAEKSLFDGVNKTYVTNNSSEYFAESVRDYTVRGSELKTKRPKTHTAINNALNKITDSHVANVQKAYAPVWR